MELAWLSWTSERHLHRPRVAQVELLWVQIAAAVPTPRCAKTGPRRGSVCRRAEFQGGSFPQKESLNVNRAVCIICYLPVFRGSLGSAGGASHTQGSVAGRLRRGHEACAFLRGSLCPDHRGRTCNFKRKFVRENAGGTHVLHYGVPGGQIGSRPPPPVLMPLPPRALCFSLQLGETKARKGVGAWDGAPRLI